LLHKVIRSNKQKEPFSPAIESQAPNSVLAEPVLHDN